MMKIAERQAKIPDPWRNGVVIAMVVVLVVAVFFDFLGLTTILKWLVIISGVVGACIGGYFVYLRTKD